MFRAIVTENIIVIVRLVCNMAQTQHEARGHLTHMGYVRVALIWLLQQPNFYLPISPPFSSKWRPNKECLVSEATNNTVRYCRHYPGPKPPFYIEKLRGN